MDRKISTIINNQRTWLFKHLLMAFKRLDNKWYIYTSIMIPDNMNGF